MKKNLFIKISFITIVIFFIVISSIGIIEKNLVYNPSEIIKPFISDIKDKAKIKSFKNSENIDIKYIHIEGNKNLPIIVYCHGNTNNSSHYQFRVKFLANKGYEIFMPDYRGFGQSGGVLSEKGFYKDVEDFISMLEDKYGIDKNQIILWGHSLGGGIVADIAAGNNFLGVILESTFTSIEGMKIFTMNNKQNPLEKLFYSVMPVSQRFDNDKKVADINSPLLIISSKNDEIIPYQMGLELSKLNKSAKFYLSEDGGHDEIGWQSGAILDFINSLD